MNYFPEFVKGRGLCEHLRLEQDLALAVLNVVRPFKWDGGNI
jgi:hypothetical protein